MDSSFINLIYKLRERVGGGLDLTSEVVYIGRKPAMNYVLAVMRNLNAPDTNELVLKARGRSITTAVDVAEITRHQFMKGMNVEKITIGTEDITQEGRTRAVSTIEIALSRSTEKAGESAPKRSTEKMEAVGSGPPLDLTAIEGIGAKSAKKLKAVGVGSVQDLAKTDARELSEKAKISEKTLARWIGQAKKR